MTYLNLRGTTFRKTRSRRTCRREILDASGGQTSADASRRGRTNRICRCRAKPFREGRYSTCLHTPNIAQTCKAEAEGEGEIGTLDMMVTVSELEAIIAQTPSGEQVQYEGKPLGSI